MLVTVSDVVTLSASIYRDYLNELMSYQKIHKLSDIDNIPTYRLILHQVLVVQVVLDW